MESLQFRHKNVHVFLASETKTGIKQQHKRTKGILFR